MAKKTTGRIVVPTNVEGLLKLADGVYKKHIILGATSPLNALEDNNWATAGSKIAYTLQKHLEAEDLRRRSEEAYKERDISLPLITDTVRDSAGLLKKINSKNPKRLGEWGFEVDDTPKTKAKKE